MPDPMESPDPILETFSRELRRLLGSRLKEVWLFGSRARADSRADSDYDFLILAEGDLQEIKALVREAEWVCMELHYALVACIVYTPQQWLDRKNSPLGWNIQRDGKLVA